MSTAYKLEWQRNQRRVFAARHGFSTAANYATGGLRTAVLKRDGDACVKCGMTAQEHLATWGRPITIDHKDKDRSHNTMDNLQTLCLSCHGNKDLIPRLRTPKAPAYKKEILELRADGVTYRDIAYITGLGVSTVYKWEQLWNTENSQ